MINPIKIVSYNPNWKQVFHNESKNILNVLQNEVAAIHHIGSTSIPNMLSKPIIDILLELEDLDNMESIKKKLNLLGYEYISRQLIPHRSFFSSRIGTLDISFNLHIYERGDPQVKRHVNFRNYLACHQEDAEIYASLKKKLSIKFGSDLHQYVLSKDDFVQSIDVKAKKWAESECFNKFLSPPSGKAVGLWSLQKLFDCIEANFNVTKTFYAQYMNGVVLIRKPGYTLINTSIIDPSLNCVIDADFPSTKATNYIEEINKYFAKTNTPFLWWILPSDSPKDLARHLEKYNYKQCKSKKIFYKNINDYLPVAPNKNFKILRVLNKNIIEDFKIFINKNKPEACSAYLASLGEVLSFYDPIEFYLCYYKDRVIAASQVCYYAGVGNIQVLKSIDTIHTNSNYFYIYDFHLQQIKNKQYSFAFTYSSSQLKFINNGWNELTEFEIYRN